MRATKVGSGNVIEGGIGESRGNNFVWAGDHSILLWQPGFGQIGKVRLSLGGFGYLWVPLAPVASGHQRNWGELGTRQCPSVPVS